MRRFLSSLIVSIIFMFVGMVSVSAATLVPNPSEVNASTSSRDYTFVVAFSGANGWKLSYDSEVYPSGNNPITNGSLSSDSGSITFAVRKGLSLTSDKEVNITITNENSEEKVSTKVIIKANQTQSSSQQQTTTPSTTQTPKSNNNNLSSLNITGDDGDEVVLSPSFSSSVYTYEATVASTVRTVSIDATLEDSKANMVISNNADEELVAGENNRITITVTAEDGSKRAYTINIAREALTADATLKELTIKEVKTFKLEDDKFTYNIKIKKGVKELTIDYALSDENASVEIDGNENLKDGSKVKITVTAEDGTKKVYTLNISVEDEDTKTDTSSISVEKNPLIIMGLSIIAFGLIGGIIYVIKK